jgi:hypothetical protein
VEREGEDTLEVSILQLKLLDVLCAAYGPVQHFAASGQAPAQH